MKRNLFILIASCFILIGTAVAKDLPSQKNNLVSFKSVHWKITLAEGGFALSNNTDRKEIIQVVHKKGSFSTFKRDTNDEVSCIAHLADDSHQLSTVCVLEPNDRLYVDLNFETLKEAEGTYQIAFEK